MKLLLKKTIQMFIFLAVTPFTISAQNWIDIHTEPLAWFNNKGNIGLHILPYKNIGITGEAAYFSNQSKVPELKTTVGGQTFDIGIRYYPFGIQEITFSKKSKRSQRNKKNDIGCPFLDHIYFKQDRATGLQKALSGIYLGMGYQSQKYEANYVSQYAPKDPYNFKVHNKGYSASFGYMVRFENITVGLNYTAVLSHPTIEGKYDDIIKDALLNNNSSHIETQFKFQIGINF